MTVLVYENHKLEENTDNFETRTWNLNWMHLAQGKDQQRAIVETNEPYGSVKPCMKTFM